MIRRLTGLSLSFCIKDIIAGRVNENEVVEIIAATRIYNDEQFEEVIGDYAPIYWREAPNRAMAIARRFWEKGMIDQPRTRGEMCHNIAAGHWIVNGKQTRDPRRVILTKGMFIDQSNPNSNLFGLQCNQTRRRKTDDCHKVAHNAGWFNKRGERIGYGDLSIEDLLRISEEIDDDELFIVMSEYDSFLRFVVRPGNLGCMHQTDVLVEAPGVDYVAAHALIVIGRCHWAVVNHSRTPKNDHLTRDGMTFQVLLSREVKKLMSGDGYTWTYVRQLVGKSLSMCVADIANGIVDEKDVAHILAATCVRSDEEFEEVISEYGFIYWREFETRAKEIARRLWRSKKIIQWRLRGYEPLSIINGHWLYDGSEIKNAACD